MNDISKRFVEYIIQQVKDNKGKAAALRRADNPNTAYLAWEVLAEFGVELDDEHQCLVFSAIAADIARVKPQANGKILMGHAIARCYDNRHQSDPAKAKLRRLLACDSTAEACQMLRPLFSFMASKGISLNYVALLNDLLWFDHDESRQRIKAKWAQQFYGNQDEEGDKEEGRGEDNEEDPA